MSMTAKINYAAPTKGKKPSKITFFKQMSTQKLMNVYDNSKWVSKVSIVQ
jgi:hypothetical protein